MKHFTLLLLIGISGVLSAQSFSTLNQSNQVFFLSDHFDSGLYPDIDNPQVDYTPYHDSTIIGYRVDSTFYDSLVHAETFLFNRIKRQIYYSLANVQCDSVSWMGPQMIRRSDGMEIYKNGMGEEIYYNTNASLGDSWTMFDGIWGTCTATLDTLVYVDTILGEADSIYTILCDFDIFPVPRADTILIGKTTGFIKMLDHFMFPTDTVPIKLSGVSYPKKGLTPPDEIDYHTYSIGDEIHVYDEWGVPFYHVRSSRRIIKIIDKEENDSTITYNREIEWCSCADCTDPEFNRTFDVVTYRKDYLANMPFEDANLIYISDGEIFEDKPIDFYSQIPPVCWGCRETDMDWVKCYSSDSDSPGGVQTSKKGLGLLRNYAEEGEPNGGRYKQFDVVYYQINGHEYGFPFDFSNCYIGTNNVDAYQNIKIQPNPSDGSFSINGLPEARESLTLKIMDMQGKEVYYRNHQTGFEKIDLNISNGIYFLILSDSAYGVVLTRKLLISR